MDNTLKRRFYFTIDQHILPWSIFDLFFLFLGMSSATDSHYRMPENQNKTSTLFICNFVFYKILIVHHNRLMSG